MRILLSLVAVLALVVGTTTGQAEEVKSGLQKGEKIGAYYVDKYAGNENDSVEVGATLCYRCKMGKRPVVTVFAKGTDENLTALIKELDAIVEKNKDKKLAAYVNLIGEDQEEMKKAAKTLIKESKAKNVAVVGPAKGKKGWDNLKINGDAQVTVLAFKNGVIEANYALSEGQLDKECVSKIVADAGKLVK